MNFVFIVQHICSHIWSCAGLNKGILPLSHQQIADKTRELNEIEEKWTVKLQGLHNTMDSSEQAHNENVSQLKEKLGTAETLITQIQEETAARLR